MRKLKISLLLFALLPLALAAQFGPFLPSGLGGGGAIFSPAFNPHDASECYIACDMNDLFHTTDDGASWDILPFGSVVPIVQASVQYSSDPNRRYALSKTFVMNYVNIKTSTDGGQSWSNLPNPTATPAYYGLFANPQQDGEYLVSSGDAIYFTDDDGQSYSTVYGPVTMGDCHMAGAFFDGSNYYVCCNRGLITSTDAGSTWSAPNANGITLSNEEIYSFAAGKTGTGIRFLAVTSASGNVLAGAKPSAGINNNFKGIFGLTLGQSSWTNYKTGLNLPNYDKPMLVAMAGNDSSTAYMAGYTKVGNFSAHTVFKSTDAGRTWANTFVRPDVVQPYDTTNAYNNNFISPGWYGYSNADNQTSWWTIAQNPLGLGVDPNNANTVIVMNSSASHASTDGGTTWVQKYLAPGSSQTAGQVIQGSTAFASSGFENTGSWDIVWADSLNMMAGYNDILATRSTDGGITWGFNYSGLKRPTNPNSNSKDVAQWIKHPSTGDLYAAAGYTLGQGGSYVDAYVDPVKGAVMKSTDKGATWTTLKNFLHVVSSVCLDPSDPNRMYATVCNYAASGYAGGIYVCTDITQGTSATWTMLAVPSGTAGRPNSIQVLQDGTLLASYGARDAGGGSFSNTSGVFYSTDAGSSWQLVSLPAMNYSVRSVAVDPNDTTESTWWVCTHAVSNVNAQAGLWRTTNRGQAWIHLSTHACTTIAFDPLSPGDAWFGTERGGLWYIQNAESSTPSISQCTEYPFIYPWKVIFNPYNPSEMWVTSFGNGLRKYDRSMKRGGSTNGAHPELEQAAANNAEGWVAYPNPGHGLLSLRSQAEVQVEDVWITDMSGRSVPAIIQKLNDQRLELKTENLPAGMYTVSIRTAQGQTHLRWVKK